MAKHPKRSRRGRKYRRYLKGQINATQDIGTLAGRTLQSQLVTDTLTEKAWLSSVKATWALSDVTQSNSVGPLMVGVAHSDYTNAEVEAWIEQTSSWEQGDKIAQEVAKRKIRRVGVFQLFASDETIVLNDGKPITTKCGWQLVTGQTVRIWAYNMGSGAFATTTPQLMTEGHANLWPN